MTRSRRAVVIVGIGEDGCLSLSSRAVNTISNAELLVGGARHLAFFPEFRGKRIVLRNGVGAALEHVAELAEEHNICILASGDPLFFGVASSVIGKVGAAHVEVIPQPSSMQLAFARVGLKWDDAVFLSFHGRPLSGLLTRLRSASKAAVFTDDENTPARIATHMTEHGETGWKAWVCERLGGPDERVRSFAVTDLAKVTDIAPLNVLLLVRSQPNWRPQPAIPFLHEDAFAKRMPKKGLITKREVRLLSLAHLHVRPNSIVWDIGAGSGSVSIEVALLAPDGCVYAVEMDPESVHICKENVRAHAVDNVHVIFGRAPDALADLEAPDAVFIGGTKGSMEEIVRVALERVTRGGRLVVNAVTLENAHEAYAAIRRHGLVPEVTLLQVSRAEPLARYLRYEALSPIQTFVVEKPCAVEEA